MPNQATVICWLAMTRGTVVQRNGTGPNLSNVNHVLHGLSEWWYSWYSREMASGEMLVFISNWAIRLVYTWWPSKGLTGEK